MQDNKKLVERLRHEVNMGSGAVMPLRIQAADALDTADNRVAELEALVETVRASLVEAVAEIDRMKAMAIGYKLDAEEPELGFSEDEKRALLMLGIPASESDDISDAFVSEYAVCRRGEWRLTRKPWRDYPQGLLEMLRM